MACNSSRTEDWMKGGVSSASMHLLKFYPCMTFEEKVPNSHLRRVQTGLCDFLWPVIPWFRSRALIDEAKIRSPFYPIGARYSRRIRTLRNATLPVCA